MELRPTQSVPVATLLIVEDHKDTLYALETFLRRLGYSIETAATGEEGLARFRTGTYAATVSDLIMPVKSGEEMAADIRRLGSDIPISLMTSTPEAVRDASLFTEIFRKPFELQDFGRRLTEILNF